MPQTKCTLLSGIILLTLLTSLQTASANTFSGTEDYSNEFQEFQDALKDLDRKCSVDIRCARIAPTRPPIGTDQRTPYELFCIMFPRLCQENIPQRNAADINMR